MDQDGANAESSARRGLGSISVTRWLFVMVCIAIGLALLAYNVRNHYWYQIGTPATATSIQCRSEASQDASGAANDRCIGTWIVAGQSQTGPIEPVPGYGTVDSRSRLDVHVKDGIAFTADSSRWGLKLVWSLAPILVGLGALIGVDKWWRQQR
jgi:hypothetical protein